MSVPFAGDTGPTYRVAAASAAPYQDNRKSAFISISIAIVVIAAGMSVLGVLFVRYTGRFRRMDHSRESLSWDGSPGNILRTVYKNPVYGLTLTLPGEWRPSRRPTPYLCHLIGFGRFNALLEADFPILTPSIDDDVSLVVRNYTASPGWSLKSKESLTISGLPAEVLHLQSPRDVDVDMLMVKKWPVVYGLSVAGPSGDSDDWKFLRASLAQALDVK